jgi:hypothetical protein
VSRAFEPKPDNIAVAQLVHLHADLGGKLLACQAQAQQLASDMRHVEAVIGANATSAYDRFHGIPRLEN